MFTPVLSLTADVTVAVQVPASEPAGTLRVATLVAGRYVTVPVGAGAASGQFNVKLLWVMVVASIGSLKAAVIKLVLEATFKAPRSGETTVTVGGPTTTFAMAPVPRMVS